MIVKNAETNRESEISLRSFQESLFRVIHELTFVSGTKEEEGYFNKIKQENELKNATEEDKHLLLTQ